MNWFLDNASSILILPTILLVFFLLKRNERSSSATTDGEGWKYLHPTMGLHLLGALSVMMAGLTIYGLGLNLINLITFALSGDDGIKNSLISLLLLVPLTAVPVLMICLIWFYKVRWNADQVEYRRVIGPYRKCSWKDVEAIVNSAFWGTYLRTKSGKIYAWEYFGGFTELAAEAEQRGIHVPDIVKHKS